MCYQVEVSATEVLTNVTLLSVIAKPRKEEGLGPLCALHSWRGKSMEQKLLSDADSQVTYQ
jgi:hypothetical protein